MQLVQQRQQRSYWQIYWTPERIRTIKVYAYWWAAFACAGSLFLKGSADTFPELLWNPFVWNLAGLIASVFTFWQLQSDICPLQKTDFDKVFVGGGILFFVFGGFHIWERLLPRDAMPIHYCWLFWGSMVIIGLCISIWRVINASFFNRVNPIGK